MIFKRYRDTCPLNSAKTEFGGHHGSIFSEFILADNRDFGKERICAAAGRVIRFCQRPTSLNLPAGRQGYGEPRRENMLILALLDKPGRESFGMVPFVARFGDGSMCPMGFAGRPNGVPITSVQLHDLLHAGHALDVSSVKVEASEQIASPVAGWLGRGFEEKFRTLEAPVPDLPAERVFLGDRGSFWIENTAQMYMRLFRWTVKTAKRAIREKNAPLADLLAWALPNEPETQAAIWYTRGSKDEQDECLAWQLRWRPLSTRVSLLSEFNTFIQYVLGKSV